MEYSGPAAIAEVEHDLSDEEQAMEHWPPLKPSARHEFQSVAAFTSMKRPKDYESDTSSEPQSPAAKLTKCSELPTRQKIDITLPHNFPLPVPSVSPSAAPAFAPHHVALSLEYSIQTHPINPHHRTRISIPPKYLCLVHLLSPTNL
ncbi:hypothetical protein Pcinc_036920 [Petrolisthes cinctipes]|uniref:Uncharacterized protein n=1 Tax=Petrolisthes cinctipes TaxID=88211 RepID=A0AAE1BTK3_PETCI|nr:hypothetical protein Pcinc_036920 [Petrolisthes cinctipes]